VQTLERAAALLRRAISPGGIDAILAELGFPGPPLPLGRDGIDALGLPAAVRSVRIAPGRGALRALALELDDSGDTRETLIQVAGALGRNASQFLWLVVASRASTAESAIVCWRSDGARVRLASSLWRPDRIAHSDAETLCTLAAVGGDSDLLTHARWLDVLGREAITSRFFRNLQRVITDLDASLTGRIDAADRRDLALLCVSRLIFLSFLETKGWLNGDFSFLANGYSRCMEAGGRYQRRVLEPLFFGTLNTVVSARSPRAREFGRIPFLNGGLFSRSPLEKQRRDCVFSDEALGNAFASLFSHYRFSGREDSAEWSEASIDPEILGKAFEALMGSADRKKSGAFYTPQELVDGLSSHALGSVMRLRSAAADRSDFLRRIKVLDPACGSGAFLVHVLERLATLRRADGESGSISEIRRRVLTHSIFGVDLSPMAVWLCELRLWLSIVVESDEPDPMRIPPLPNLDHNIRIGDSLAGVAFGNTDRVSGTRKFAALRGRYVKATGPRKLTLARALDRMARISAIDVLGREIVRLTAERKGMLAMARARDLFGLRHPPDPQTRIRLEGIRRGIREANQQRKALREGAALPFSFGAQFADIAAGGGFDLVIGNPPWVRIHRIAEASRQRLRQSFTVYRRAAWESGATGAGAGRGFAAQIDLAALFVERGCDLLRQGGTLAYLLPSKLWRSLAGGGVRELLIERADIVLIEDLSRSRSQFDAAVYPSLLVARLRREPANAPSDARVAAALPPPDRIAIRIRAGGTTRGWRCPPHRLSVDGTPGSPWLLVPGSVRKAFDYLTRCAAPLRASRFGRPLLGVKTGCNDAYLVRVDSLEGDTARVCAGDRVGEIEREILRPVIRGETLGRWMLAARSEYVVWTHSDDGASRRELPPLAHRWLSHHRNTLSNRTDLHPRSRWWSLFRTESAAFDQARVIWADFGLRPRAIAVAEGEAFVALNTCYVLPCVRLDDAHALAAILNGPLAAAWLNAIAEPARGGYRRYLGWTMAMLPIPVRWNRARRILAPLGHRAMQGEIPSDEELLAAALEAYRVAAEKVRPLLSWNIDGD
jgi:Eco57I restriction-modification methylase